MLNKIVNKIRTQLPLRAMLMKFKREETFGACYARQSDPSIHTTNVPLLQSSKASATQRMAGLLTYLISRCLPSTFLAKCPISQWLCILTFEKYSSGTVQDSHLIPF